MGRRSSLRNSLLLASGDDFEDLAGPGPPKNRVRSTGDVKVYNPTSATSSPLHSHSFSHKIATSNLSRAPLTNITFITLTDPSETLLRYSEACRNKDKSFGKRTLPGSEIKVYI